MTVRSEDMKPRPEEPKLRPPARPRTPHVIPAHVVETGAIMLLWVIAVLLWIASTFGNFVQFVGGWALVWPLNAHTAAGILYALLYQGIVTIAQWGFKAKRWWPLYILALLASALPSFVTYNSWWINPWIVARLGPATSSHIADEGCREGAQTH